MGPSLGLHMKSFLYKCFWILSFKSPLLDALASKIDGLGAFDELIFNL
jgi:hypothetical protein